MNSISTDRIEKQVLLRVPRSRVWRALTEADQFGQWFGAKLANGFGEGVHVKGQMTHPGYEHIPFNVTVERLEPESVFAWRWHVLLDGESGRASETTTLVEFHLEDVAEGTMLTVTESGFDSMPPEYRDIAFRGNEGGWSQQMVSIEKFLAASA